MIKYLFSILRNNYKYLITIISFFIVGVLLGIFFKSEIQNQFFYDNFLNKYIIIIDVNSNVFSNSLYKCFSTFLILIVVLITSFTIFSLPLHFVIVIYQGFILSAVFPISIQVFSFSGVVLYLIVILPCAILRFTSTAVLSTLCFNKLKLKSRCNNNDFSAYLLYFLIAFMLCVISCLYEIVIISIVIRPLNLII